MKTETQIEEQSPNMARRSFLRYAGAGVAGLGILGVTTSCNKKNGVYPDMTGIDIGANSDLAILNYAYTLEQLEAAFYIQVAATPFSGITTAETALLTDIRDHEVAHREFFKAALKTNAIQVLAPDFSSIDFSSRTKVLAAAQAFEDLGVQAYNGAGYLIKSADYLTLAGKIVSVEARHAAYIRNLINPGSFADNTIIDANGLDKQKTIGEVLATANTFLKTKVNASNYGYVSF